jgi:predicted ATPase/DNA-binding CsgD family transcriptional regulator
MHPTISRTPHHQRGLADRRVHQRRQPLQPRHRSDLPQELSSFVGSPAQVSSLVAEVRAARLLTLTGCGGIGKTRLALQVARAVHTDYERCSWIPLGGIVNPTDIASLIAAAIGAGWASNFTDAETLVAGIGDHQLLLVLDNCEHLLGACADVVMRLLQGCPRVCVVATSREPLGVPGEVVYRVEPLELPREDEPLEQQMQSEAARLFIERARARGARFEPSDETCTSVVAICRTLKGVPLAIELAATSTSSMTVGEIAARLYDDVLGALAVGPRALPPRQQSLRGSLDWSHALLQDAEQRMLRRLAPFVDEFTMDDAVDACGCEDLTSHDIVVLLDRLVTHSLVQASEHHSRMWFSLPAHVRAYGLERLAEAGELGHVRGGIDRRAPEPDAAPGTDDAGVPWLEDRARSGEHQLPHSLAKTDPRRARGLSERERDVVALIASGRSNRQIAEELVITKKTAEAHVSHILTKLGLCSRVQIATWSLCHGLARSASDAVGEPEPQST